MHTLALAGQIKFMDNLLGNGYDIDGVDKVIDGVDKVKLLRPAMSLLKVSKYLKW